MRQRSSHNPSAIGGERASLFSSVRTAPLKIPVDPPSKRGEKAGHLNLALDKRNLDIPTASFTKGDEKDFRLALKPARNSRGFTMVELMVALVMVALIHAIVIGFYLYQSKRGGQAAKETSARRGIALTLMQLQRDVVQMGYGVSRYPQLACYLETQNPSYPKSNKGYYDTLYVNYGQFMRATIPATGTNSPYTMWPALVYNLYNVKPMNSTNLIGGTFSIPFTSQAEAQANRWSVGAVIYLTNPTTPATASSSVQLATTPGTVPATPVTAGQTMANPPSGWVTQFAVQGSVTGCGAVPAGNYYFAPAVVYTFQPPQIDSATGLIKVPGQIWRNGQSMLGGGGQNTSASVQDSFFSVYDFQIRGLFIPVGGGTQKWAPTDDNFCTLIKTSNLRYVEIQIVYTIEQGGYRNLAAGKTANPLKTVTRLIRVNPRTVVLSTY
jgi:prepilin-type N-terminal cleavage/methylation domain-containing protein